MIKRAYFLAIAVAAAVGFTALSAGAQNPPADQGAQAQQGAKGAKKKTSTKSEVQKSLDSGTVPAKYRSSVPKEYQQHIPFAKPGQ